MIDIYKGQDDDYGDYITDALEQAAKRCRDALLRLANPDLPAAIPTHYLTLLYMGSLNSAPLLQTLLAAKRPDVDLPYPMGVQIIHYAHDNFKDRGDSLGFMFDFLADTGKGLARSAISLKLYNELLGICRDNPAGTDFFEEEVSVSLALLADADYDCKMLAQRINRGNINKANVVPVLVHNFNATAAYVNALIANSVAQAVLA